MSKIFLVNKEYISENNKYYDECVELTYKSKLLYNSANYLIKTNYQNYINNSGVTNINVDKGKILSNHTHDDIYNLIINSGQSLNTKFISKFFLITLLSKTDHKNYRALPTNISNYVIFDVSNMWISFFNALSDYKIFPNKYLGRPRPPKYLKDKHKVTYDAHDILNMNRQTRDKIKSDKTFKLSCTNIEFELNYKKGRLKQVVINPTIIGFNLEFIYETTKPDLKPYNGRVVGIDLGVSNLMTVVNNFDEPFYIVNGKPIASINRYSNKKISNLQKKLGKNIHTSRQIKETYLKRKFKLDYELNCISKYLVEECVKQNVTKIVIGNNKGWKQNSKLGVKTNQRFQSIPYAELICKIIYKAAMEGIEVIVTEESYTSKCSFFDNETLTKHKYYAGKRVNRGLFVTGTNIKINADVNGALNIIRKVVHGFNFNEVNIGLAVNPHVVFISGYNKPKGKLNHIINLAA